MRDDAAGPASSPRSHRGAETRAHLIEAAKAVFEEKGFLETRVSDITAAALGAMTWQFAEEWLVQGQPDCDFDTGVGQITRLIVNALRLREPRTRARREATLRSENQKH